MLQATEFLKKYRFDWENVTPRNFVPAYVEEMARGLRCGESSLLMQPSYVRMARVRRGEPVVAVDAGGTNLRIARILFDEAGGCVFESEISKYPMLGAGRGITADEFYDRLSDMIAPHMGGARKCVLSFAFPTRVMDGLEAQALYLTKEVVITGIEQTLLARDLSAALAKKGFACRVCVTNDTVATSLAGMAERLSMGYDGYTGTILGTGVNNCYIEKVENIDRVTGCGGSMMINVEAGGYAHFPRTDIDVDFDNGTHNPGESKAEKMISGGYLGPLAGHYLNVAAREGVFSPGVRFDGVETRDVSGLLSGGGGAIAGSCATQADADCARAIAQALVKRAARMAAVQMAACAIKSGSKNILMTAEGSTYYKLHGMREEIERTLYAYLEAEGVHADVIEVEHAVLKGCALAGCMQGE